MGELNAGTLITRGLRHKASTVVRALVLCVCTTTPIAMAEPASGEQLLERMHAAFAELDYDGVFTYFTGNDLSTLRVVHKRVDGVQKERLVHLDGAPREILRHGDQVTCIVLPDDDLVALEESIPAGPFARAFVRQFDRVAESYHLETQGEGRIAGRVALRVAVKPKASDRYGFRLWLDAEHDLLLRSELVDHQGQRLEIFQFATIAFGPDVQASAVQAQQLDGSMVSHLRLEPKDQSSRVTNTDQDTVAPSAASWSTGWLPPGFRMANADVRRKPSHAVTSMIYSDGLAAFSIFVEPMPPGGAASLVSKNGATVALNRHVAVDSEHFLVTLVGEIPLDTAQKIVASVAPAAG